MKRLKKCCSCQEQFKKIVNNNPSLIFDKDNMYCDKCCEKDYGLYKEFEYCAEYLLSHINMVIYNPIPHTKRTKDLLRKWKDNFWEMINESFSEYIRLDEKAYKIGLLNTQSLAQIKADEVCHKARNYNLIKKGVK